MTAEQFVDALWQLTGTAPREPHKNVAEFLTADETKDRTAYRASLVSSDLLMRSLGRPNREQVVTDRPDDAHHAASARPVEQSAAGRDAQPRCGERC